MEAHRGGSAGEPWEDRAVVTGNVVRLRAAREDIVAHATYLGEEADLDTALRFLTALQEAFELLAKMPLIGPQSRFSDPRLRTVRIWTLSEFKDYVVLYRPSDDGIQVLRVIHGRRDYLRFEKEMDG